MRILINEFDDIRIEIERGLNALYAIDYAMENGACSADSFTEGLYFVYSGLCDQLEKLKEVGNKMEIYERNRTIKREKFVVHIWRTRGAQNHEMCATAIKGYKKHMP